MPLSAAVLTTVMPLHGTADCQLQRLQSVQNAAVRLVTGLQRMESHHADPEVSTLVTDSATGDLQAANSGAQMRYQWPLSRVPGRVLSSKHDQALTRNAIS